MIQEFHAWAYTLPPHKKKKKTQNTKLKECMW